MTAAAAIKGIREIDTQNSIGLISAEPDPPYDRPPLSKGLWKGKPIDKIWRNIDGMNVAEYLGHTVTRIDPHRKTVSDDGGTTYAYDKLLLAIGGRPRRLPFGSDHIIYFRTLAIIGGSRR